MVMRTKLLMMMLLGTLGCGTGMMAQEASSDATAKADDWAARSYQQSQEQVQQIQQYIDQQTQQRQADQDAAAAAQQQQQAQQTQQMIYQQVQTEFGAP